MEWIEGVGNIALPVYMYKDTLIYGSQAGMRGTLDMVACQNNAMYYENIVTCKTVSNVKTYWNENFFNAWGVQNTYDSCTVIYPSALQSISNLNPLTIYPNPSNGAFTITNLEQGTYSILNELGQIVHTFTTTNTIANITRLTNGIYILQSNTNSVRTKIAAIK